MADIAITPSKAKLWSKLGSRATYGMSVLELSKVYDDLVVLTADTSTSAGLDRFRKTAPDKHVECGIAEQNMVGIAAGMASEGLRVISSTFAPFQTMRCCEQIRVNLGYMRQPVRMVGLASGVVLGPLGYTHCCIEDLSVMRSIPNMTVLSPADCGETAKATAAALAHDGPVYIRLTGGTDSPVVYDDDYDFQIGRAVTLRDGDDVALIATGMQVHESLRAADMLAEQGIESRVIDMHTIKPIDREAVLEACVQTRLIVTLEEHSVIGGLGGAVAEVVAGSRNAPVQLTMGLPDSFGKPKDYSQVIADAGLDAAAISKRVAAALRAA
jgi:transketolase